jgi:DNA-binding XRE family transcriptional regulator
MAISAEDVFAKSMTPEQRAAAAQRGHELVLQYLTMQQLRKARHLTQEQLAQMLGKDQVQISQLEKRSDMLLSTLRSYVEAMGGSLHLVVEFENSPPVFLSGLTDDTDVPASSEGSPNDHGPRQLAVSGKR